ncbi:MULTISPECIES: hypothetical protein [unclassified Leeuwenhoekiella]|uniref:hypothetical protein n=1 Tax=unclassified Leeuwenhoekiella TaxID=2615029 RepID=UPI000C454586|nr:MULTISPECIES: hypothetical protein [unclassified Leeuwenhoekiella]MAW94067.1 hypothetical protein [Leeuwenhoekiella sp.]MBA80894.1 hypothetical protein [Leeuwenhoekiella sp.]|tara:strand:+ start:69168 stop:69509 length:342 start_codon:yes stop_codon:yes gene_type:complete
MKLLISIISLITISFSPVSSDTEDTKTSETLETYNATLVNQELTYDGYEGEYYFFTDADFQAVVLECSKKLPVDLINGNFEGKKFQVSYQVAERTSDSSSEGTIQNVALTENK